VNDARAIISVVIAQTRCGSPATDHGTGKWADKLPERNLASHALRKRSRGIIALEFCFGIFGAEPEDVHWHRPPSSRDTTSSVLMKRQATTLL
jgi:hypothetical protein